MNHVGSTEWPFRLSSLVHGLRLSILSNAALSSRIVSRSLLSLFLLLISACFAAAQSNPIVVENAKPGNPPSEWDISGSGDSSIQGFATDISVNKGGTIQFKIKTNASNYRLDIYRLGYYGGLGARFVDTVFPSAALPQSQPNPITNSATGLIDCGNWAESASWTVPADATSGVYIAKLIRTDTGGASHIAFVVRDDSSTSDLIFQTSDTTWQAYNSWGGNSLYVGSPADRAYKVSYNRPFNTRDGETSYDWLFSAEYPMIRWLEANGYDVSYTSGVDTDRRGNLLTNHKVFLSVGHDEYWSDTQRSNVEAARNAGVNLAFFSGNEVFWKTRWEPSIDGSGTAYRTLVCYKETHANAKIDPTSTWTGTWRDPRFSSADGGRPENALTGTLFMVNGHREDTISVPGTYGAHRFWRNTSVASLSSTQVATFPAGTLGYEWDSCPTNGVQPSGLMRLSSTTLNNLPVLQDYGSTYSSGEATHSLSLYRHSSGALVFGAGTVQWSWGLDAAHDNGPAAADSRMRQATVNLFADMGVQAATLQPGLASATQSSDITSPTSIIQSPQPGTTLQTGSQVVITGTASDLDGQVWGVEVSIDGGTTWQPAVGGGIWTYTWTPTASGSMTIKSRAVDDSGNLETAAPGVTVTVVAGVTTIWPGNAVPGIVDHGPDSPVELGVKFYSEVGGVIKGIRFYKSSLNSGPHVGNLWSSTGTLLASARFTPSQAPFGWQQANFATPVPIDSFTIYVASYHSNSGHYSVDENYFSSAGADNSPLHAPASGGSWGSNGVYVYSASSAFPNQTFKDNNYWVDVVLQAGPAPTLSSIAITPASPTVSTGATQQFTAMGTYSDGSTQDITTQVTWSSSNPSVVTIGTSGLATTVVSGNTTITASQSGVSGNATLVVQNSPLTITTTSLPNGAVDSAYSSALAASGGTPSYVWSIVGESGSLPPGLSLDTSSGAIVGTPTTVGNFTFTAQVTDAGNPVQAVTKQFSITISTAVASTLSIWPSNAIPGAVDSGPDSPVELGVKFYSEVGGVIKGIRFYKSSLNSGPHVGNLWSSTGTLLASARFTPNEAPFGWQQVNFTTPVAISANTTYVASYHTNTGHFSVNRNYFSSAVDNAPLHALANGESVNGVYQYGPSSAFPTQTWNASNYWVDVVFQPGPAPTLTSIAVSPATSTIEEAGSTQQFTATGTYSDGSTQDLSSQVSWTSSNTAVATVNESGLASATSAGSTTISATMSSVTGNATLTVQAAPLTITMNSLPNGTVKASYSATLAGSGGSSPYYTWSILSGSLPAGLNLNPNSGAITGTPTTEGTFSFTG